MDTKFPLLPQYFKKIGLGLMVLGVAIPAALNSFDLIMFEKGTLKTIVLEVILVCMLIIALAKEKVEDEFVTKIRMQAFAVAFISGVAYVVIWPFINLLLEGEFFLTIDAFNALTFMLFIYLINFYNQKSDAEL
ncbi:MAG: hypothetical protein AAGI38_16675 [Bacteroidota bacterium]